MAGPKVNGGGVRGARRAELGGYIGFKFGKGLYFRWWGLSPPPPTQWKWKMKCCPLECKSSRIHQSIVIHTALSVTDPEATSKSAAVRRCRPISAVRVREGISKKRGGGFRALPLKLMQMVHSETIFWRLWFVCFLFSGFSFWLFVVVVVVLWGGGFTIEAPMWRLEYFEKTDTHDVFWYHFQSIACLLTVFFFVLTF